MLKLLIIWIMFAASLKLSKGERLDTYSHTFCMNANNTGSHLQLVPASEGEKIEMECQFCRSERDEELNETYIWYQKDVQNKLKETPISVNATSDDRLFVNEDVLVIKSFKEIPDSKRYACRPMTNQTLQASSKIEYLVDALSPSLAAPVGIVLGNSSALSSFEQEHIIPLASFVQKELSSIIKMQWNKQSLCQECLSEIGRRLTRGRCTLQTINSTKFPYNLTELSCRSTLLPSIISDELKVKLFAIPDFDLEETCDCPKLVAAADNEDDNQNPRFFLPESSKWNIKCPFLKYPEAHVNWYKDNKLLNARRTQPDDKQCSFWCQCGNIYVSPYSHDLTVFYAAPSIAGNYSCRTDGKVWEFEIRVYDVTRSCTLTKDAILFIISILLLLIFIMCCGIIAKICKCCDTSDVEPVTFNTSDTRIAGRNVIPVGNPVPIRMDVLFQPMQPIAQQIMQRAAAQQMQPYSSAAYAPSAPMHETRTAQAPSTSTQGVQETQQRAPEPQRGTYVGPVRTAQRAANRTLRNGPAPTPGSM